MKNYQTRSQLPRKSTPKEPSSISTGSATPLINGSNPSVRSLGPLKLRFSTKRSRDTNDALGSSSKRLRAADDADTSLSTPPDDCPVAEAQLKTPVTSKRTGSDDYRIDGLSPVGYEYVDGINDRCVYEVSNLMTELNSYMNWRASDIEMSAMPSCREDLLAYHCVIGYICKMYGMHGERFDGVRHPKNNREK